MNATDPRDITRELLLELRQPSEVALSADGETVAFVATATSMEKGDVLASGIWIGPADGPVEELTYGPGLHILPRFSPDGDARLAFASDRDHFGRMSLYLLQPDGQFKPHGDIKGTIEGVEWTLDSSQIFVLAADMGSDSAGFNVSRVIEEEGAEEPDPLVKRPEQTWRRIFAIDAETGSTVEVSPEGLNVWEFAIHPTGLVAIVSDKPSESAWYDAYVALIDPISRTFSKIYEPKWQIQAPHCSPDGSRVAFVEGATSDRLVVTATITVVELSSGQTRQLAVDRDVTELWWVSNERLAFVGRTGLEMNCGFVSVGGDVEEVWSGPEQIGKLHDTEMTVDRTGTRFAAVKDTIGVPPEVCVLDIADEPEPHWRPITSLNEALRDIPVPEVQELTWQSDDGLEIEGLVLTPPGGRDQPLPLVVVVHGGPSANWSYCFAPGYLANALCFANAGYAVLLPNPRGSTGRGPGFLEANIGDLGGGDFRDILAGIDACVDAGIVDGNRVGITGVSSGGLMAAWAVTQTDRFAAAIPISIISNWLSFHNTGNIGRFDELFLQSDPYDQAGRHFELSPVAHAKKVRTPTLIMQGDIDIVTPRSQAQEFYQALVEADCVTELVIYPREGHGHAWAEREHLRDYWARVKSWFDRYLEVANVS